MQFLNKRPYLSAALLGAIAAGALPPFTLPPLLLVAIPGLLALIGRAPTARAAGLRGLVFGFALSMTGLYWVTFAVLVMAAEFWWAVPIVVPLLSFVLALFIAIPCAVARLVPAGWQRLCVLAGLWVLGDIAREFVLSGFPWNPLGSVWEMPGWLGLAMIQPACWLGIGGLTLGTLLVAGSLALGRRGRIAGAGLLVAWLAAGAWRLQASAPSSGLIAVIAQGNVSEQEHRDHGGERAWAEGVFERYLALTREGVRQAGGGRILVVWPETASPYALAQDLPARQAIAQAAGPALMTLAGTERFESRTVAHNSLVAVAPDASVAAVYDKAHLVPFGEYFPVYANFILGEQGFVPGPGLRTLHLAGLGRDRAADLLRGDLPGPGRGPRGPAVAAGQYHQRCLVRRFGRAAPTPGRGAHANGRGRAADGACGEHRRVHCDRPARPDARQPGVEHEWRSGVTGARTTTAHVFWPIWVVVDRFTGFSGISGRHRRQHR